ncbi:MAG TPA: adenylate kinase [Acidimicrobiia bacterium]
MHRIVVVGCSGSGKTTLARQLASRLDFPHMELDGVYHQPNWEPLPGAEFRARVAGFALQPQWVIDGNYTSEGIQELLWPVADTLVWLDPPKRVVMARVTRRTMSRWLTRQEMWNGNREPITGPFRLNPEKSVIRWAWTRYDHVREKYEELLAGTEAVHLRTYRLRTRGEVEVFLASISND